MLCDGAQYELAYIVELQQYDTIDEANQLTLKIEYSRQKSSYRSTSNWFRSSSIPMY